jgi:hypothetical protein
MSYGGVGKEGIEFGYGAFPGCWLGSLR